MTNDINLPAGAEIFVNELFQCVERNNREDVHKYNIAFLCSYLPKMKPVATERCLKTIQNLAEQV